MTRSMGIGYKAREWKSKGSGLILDLDHPLDTKESVCYNSVGPGYQARRSNR
jgi:hypothetical protein